MKRRGFLGTVLAAFAVPALPAAKVPKRLTFRGVPLVFDDEVVSRPTGRLFTADEFTKYAQEILDIHLERETKTLRVWSVRPRR